MMSNDNDFDEHINTDFTIITLFAKCVVNLYFKHRYSVLD